MADPVKCEMFENSKAAMKPEDAKLSSECFDLQMQKAARNIGKPSMSDQLTKLAAFHAGDEQPDGQGAKSVREVLNAAGIPLERVGDAKNIKEIPGMTQLPEGEMPKAGDVIVVGPRIDRPRDNDPGNAMIALGNGEVANNHKFKEPDFSKYEFHRVFRANDSK